MVSLITAFSALPPDWVVYSQHYNAQTRASTNYLRFVGGAAPGLGKCLMMALALTASAGARERTQVLLQGKAHGQGLQRMTWTLTENGVRSKPGAAEGFKVASGRHLIIKQVAFTLRGSSAASRAAHYHLAMRQGRDTFELAEVTGQLLPYLHTNTLGKKFTPGLLVPAGAEVLGGLMDLTPGDGAARVEITLYGYFVDEPAN